MTRTTPTLRWEDAAEEVTVTGWACVKCRRWCGYGASGEQSARYCCHTEGPCSTPDCTGRVRRGYTLCDGCRDLRDAERFAKLERVEWDGKTPLYADDYDKYLFDEDDVFEFLREYEVTPENARILLCKPNNGREFCMSEFLEDDIPHDNLDPWSLENEAAEIDEQVNSWIKAHAPFSWSPSKKAISTESLRAYVVETNNADD